jgi:serine/threonine protein kinase
MDLEAGVQFGDFRIERRLGVGGMSIVYLAKQVSMNRLVALKVLGPALDRESDKARFQREAQAVAKLNHPGIAQVFFVGQDRHVCFLAMEYVDGVSLREVIDRLAAADDPGMMIDSVLSEKSSKAEGEDVVRFDVPTATHIPQATPEHTNVSEDGLTQGAKHLMASPDFVRRCCEIAHDAALALAHAHERGVVHRDIKPENIILDRLGNPHLIDFGVARFFEDASLTNTGALVGTPMYMSPEQVTGRIKVDHRTDIYSLGLTLYELLTLRRPIVAPTREGVLRQIVTKALVPVSWKNRGVSRDVASVVHKATAKDADERYPTASDFASDLQNLLDGRPVRASIYRYLFGLQELVAARPVGVILGFFGFLLMSLANAGISFCLAIQEAVLGKKFFLVPLSISGDPFACIALIVNVLVATWAGRVVIWGNPHAYKKAMLSMAVIAASATFALGSMWKRLVTNGSSEDYLLIYITLLSMPAGFVVFLMAPSVRAWFRLADRLRSEHKQYSPLLRGARSDITV